MTKRLYAIFYCSEYDSDEYTVEKEIFSADPHSVVLPNNEVFRFEIVEREKRVIKGQILKREKLIGAYSICSSHNVLSSHMIPASELRVAEPQIEQ